MKKIAGDSTIIPAEKAMKKSIMVEIKRSHTRKYTS